ncbi:T9SS type A sorting domain-containing protein [Flammeovirga yaeyamensis]|uniref:T9SS type A sorting domain-containing protein n=1 Tax=Flammeovirga yaeyamensis TaxID=367791 RepID=A0AAX1N3J8_9BACT|nr:T9SS type A sorting domain-containing protein [Flammeovirga yaeyamensis]MBB3700632.1 hypothetical protein [Flammeovirga yaeyamensis]NMF37748.1 T9SS type A sorting domain-containing protein [Flammeovirga yaeyamensis]QWG02056.1 T9SS type A sorting domain-containing protein [Flammeovirga yaeyamensis]
MKYIYTLCFILSSMVMNAQDIFSGGESSLFTYAEIIEDPDLPVTMGDFKVTKNNADVTLYWSTYTELNNDYFSIERSIDGKQWKEIGKLKGYGNSNHEIEYEFIDEQPYLGTAYYRLKQVDFDGQFEYFGPLKVSDFDQTDVVIYPNPNNGSFYVTLHEEDIQYLKIFDGMGKEIHYSIYKKTDKLVQVVFQEHVKGMYYLKLRNIGSLPIVIR